MRSPGAIIRPSGSRGFRLLYEKRIALFAILAALPGVTFGTVLIWTHDWSRDTKISLTALELFLWLVLTLALLDQIVRPLANPDQRGRRIARGRLFLSRPRGRT